jgi:hypothetical protein
MSFELEKVCPIFRESLLLLSLKENMKYRSDYNERNLKKESLKLLIENATRKNC